MSLINNKLLFFWRIKKSQDVFPQNNLIVDSHKNDLKWNRTAFGEIILNK